MAAENQRHLEPSLGGSPLEICIALLTADIAPEEASLRTTAIVNLSELKTRDLLRGAATLFSAAAYLGGMEDIAASLWLIARAKDRLREVALIWLGPRTCPCCVAMRESLEVTDHG